MPKSKRNKVVALTKTRSKGFELKKKLHDEIKTCADDYAYAFVFSVENMRNNILKELRSNWKQHSRFFFGKNKVMASAMGKSPSDEHQPELHRLARKLRGNVGLLFTNKERDEVVSFFQTFSGRSEAKPGFVATETVELCEGPLDQFSHSMEPQFRQLGLPTALKKGVITLLSEYTICKKGDTLTPEQGRILKLFGHQMAMFKVNLLCVWASSGTFEQLSDAVAEGADDDADGDDEEDEDMG
ncbi:mRNA turnover protein 4 homolog [Sycon ciliatum]|uniref:mRNA turnover protein 4 homolog n=1 Tax=Sycon ciliatum TaxID=27933 RepID=UPI0031F6F1A5